MFLHRRRNFSFVVVLVPDDELINYLHDEHLDVMHPHDLDESVQQYQLF